MCGIAGLFDTNGKRPFEESLISSMTRALAHRGPDGEGFFREPGIALGHRRLSIIDLDGGAQPMSLGDGSVTVTYNGEIYNFKELRASLEAQGHRFLTASDTEAILHGWRAWGPHVVERLRGMFAFALWDANNQTLFLARDHLGKKPLYYTLLHDGALAFASEIKALLHHPQVERGLDVFALDEFFAYGYVPDPRTIYARIQKLPPAHTLTIKRGGEIKTARYWNLLEQSERLRQDSVSDAELIDRLRESVRLRLVSDVPVGAFLSGGVDSSAIVTQMAQLSSSPVSTFSIGFGSREFDETSYAAAVAKRYGTRHHVRKADPDCLALLPKLPQIYDEPFGDVSAVPTFYVCVETSRLVKVCLSGDGGDEALAGYRRYYFHNAEEQLRSLIPGTIRRPLFGLAANLYPKLDWGPRALRAKTTLRELSLESAEAYFNIVSALPDKARRPFYSEGLIQQLADYDAMEIIRPHFAAASALDPVQRAQYTDIMTYLPSDILVKVDRASMANSLEVRSPLLDHQFIAWALSLPGHVKLRGREGKALLKRAMEPLLPRDLLYRPKRGFTVPLARWLRGPLHQSVRDLAHSTALKSSGMFSSDSVARLTQGHLSGLQDNSKAIWLLLVFEAFLNHRVGLAPLTTGRDENNPLSQRIKAEVPQS